MRPKSPIDKVRASRDGHEFHEAWTARKALELVLPVSNLVGIAVEGLSPVDEHSLSRHAVEIADLVLYYGKHPSFKFSSKAVVLQFKYSIGSESVPFRHSDARKTIKKFADSFRDHRRVHGSKAVDAKLRFELVTNRPISRDFLAAVKGIREGTRLKGNSAKQAKGFKSASGLTGRLLRDFARLIKVTGTVGHLTERKRQLSRTLADWSAAPDALSRARLGDLKELVRDKAGSVGKGTHVIRRTDVLAALGLHGPEELFPCESSFPPIGPVVLRKQLQDAENSIATLAKPLLIHADGGIGKTVFLRSLARRLSAAHAVVVFDCFGGGAYRDPADGRHLPKRGLVHIANLFASQGACDPLLPSNDSVEDLLAAFRRRLIQTVQTLQRYSPSKKLLLFLDAIDNAAEHARDAKEPCFPKLLLESLERGGQVPGVQVIASCRSHRIHTAVGEVDCERFLLKPFTELETRQYLSSRIKHLREIELRVAYARSGGNPRILQHLALSDRGLLDKSEISKELKIEALLEKRVTDALRDARTQGYSASQIESFLAGLSILPPPIPVAEYALAHGMQSGAVSSFAADLAPLLDHTKHGMVFRDEPTETFIRQRYTADAETLKILKSNLLNHQSTSVYAARSLPGLLETLDDGEALFRLAFDERFPEIITSTVAKRDIRLARIRAAVMHAARHNELNRLVQLLMELSLLAEVSQRGSQFVIENPDLVVASGEASATRRLFEARSSWPGTRYSRLSIASVLAADLNNAGRYAARSYEWVHHYFSQTREDHREKGPERLDVAAVPLWLIADGRPQDATSSLQNWKEWYAFEVCDLLFSLIEQAKTTVPKMADRVDEFLSRLKSAPAILSAALCFQELKEITKKKLISRLSKACYGRTLVDKNTSITTKPRHVFEDGLLKAASCALLAGMLKEAQIILSFAAVGRPALWEFTDRFSSKHIVPFVIRAALNAATLNRPLLANELLPNELFRMSEQSDFKNDTEFSAHFVTLMEKQRLAERGGAQETRKLTENQWSEAQKFISSRFSMITACARSFKECLSPDPIPANDAFRSFLDLWSQTTDGRLEFDHYNLDKRFVSELYRTLAFFLIWVRNDLERTSLQSLVTWIEPIISMNPDVATNLATLLAKRPQYHDLAGHCAQKANGAIQHEHDVETRTRQYAELSRAILPASKAEAVGFFDRGLEQLDTIGSGDYIFTNELLLFAASLKGDEMEDRDVQILTNICELNIPDEPEKFPWPAFGQGLSRVSGMRGLAKLARWDDRATVSFDHTLMPYLIALLRERKITPEIALSLLRLCDPAEPYEFGTKQLGEAIVENRYPNVPDLVSDAIEQFLQNHPGTLGNTVEELEQLANRSHIRKPELSAYLSRASQSFKSVNDVLNNNSNYHGVPVSPYATETGPVVDDEAILKKIVSQTPITLEGISKALDSINEGHRAFGLKSQLLRALRQQVEFARRATYVESVAKLDNLEIYAKMAELEDCKKEWSTSSSALGLEKIAIPIVQLHSADFLSYGSLRGGLLRDVARLCDLPIQVVVRELMFVFGASPAEVPAGAWVELAGFYCDYLNAGEGQTALKRLLNSSSARLSSSVTDGEWHQNSYPPRDEVTIAAGLTWFRLGSPFALNRWRAAHCVRSLAKFERWDVIDAIVGQSSSTTAGSFQAPELRFYFLHAKLWLLIALARLALDEPKQISRYEPTLRAIALDDLPHILLRHFAAAALLGCAKQRKIKISKAELEAIKSVGVSPFAVVKRDTKQRHLDSFYRAPEGRPKREDEFSLEYDFNKYEVTRLCDLFDRPRWEIRDRLTDWVRVFDSSVAGMYEKGGRRSRGRRTADMDDEYHIYGQYLGWHASFLTAGDLLSKYPLVTDPHEAHPWEEWKSRNVLTRKDGLWLSDGTDMPPVDTKVALLEQAGDGLAITGSKAKLEALIERSSPEQLVVEGWWQSSDGIKVRVSSALTEPEQTEKIAQELLAEDPFFAWLPDAYEPDSSWYPSRTKPGAEGWIVNPNITARLDEYDPLAARIASSRPRFSKEIVRLGRLRAKDPFGRIWLDPDGTICARADAWRSGSYRSQSTPEGTRLCTTTDFLKKILTKRGRDLLLLLRLERYESGHNIEGKFWHTLAVVHFTPSLKNEFHIGSVNRLFKSAR